MYVCMYVLALCTNDTVISVCMYVDVLAIRCEELLLESAALSQRSPSRIRCLRCDQDRLVLLCMWVYVCMYVCMHVFVSPLMTLSSLFTP